MYIKLEKSLGFDDVLLVPKYSTIESRLDTNLQTNLTKNILISHPVIPTNMSTITGPEMVEFIDSTGGVAFLHRFYEYEEYYSIIKSLKKHVKNLVISVGVKSEDYNLIDALLSSSIHPSAFLIDIAHGDSLSVINLIKFLKENTSVDVIAGNIATADGYKRLCDSGADAVRVGISGGSVCTTRYVTGHGMNTFQSIIDCSKIKSEFNIPIIADGGIKNSGDIVKCLAGGADSVCIGGLFAGSSLTPGEYEEECASPFRKYKKYYGMSSEEAQKIHKNGLKRGTAAEGISKKVFYSGETPEILNKLLGGIRSGLTYSGCCTINELYKQSVFQIQHTAKEQKFE